MRRFVITQTFRGTPRTTLELLSNPSTYPSWLPSTYKATVIKETPGKRLTLAKQTLIDGATITWEEEFDTDWERKTLYFKLIKGDLQRFEGEWRVVNEGPLVTVVLTAELDWGSYNMSRFFGDILEEKTVSSLRILTLSLARAVTKRDQQTLPRFGYISNLLSQYLTANGYQDSDMHQKRPELFKDTLKWLPPFRRGIVTGLKSPTTGMKIEGDMILVNLLPEQMLLLADELAIRRVVQAGQMAERFKDCILGLGSYAANVGRKGLVLQKHLHIPVTTGTSYTIAVVIKAIQSASSMIGLDLRDASVAIVGATGSIGRICAHLLAEKTKQLTLVARQAHRLKELAGQLSEQYGIIATASTNIDEAVAKSDVVITATNTPTALIDLPKAKPGCIIYDVSQPPNVNEEEALARSDILVLDGGVVKPPGPVDFHFSFGLPPGLAYACIAEVMILALEERYEPYSLGGNISLGKVQAIGAWGDKHGFRLAGLKSFGKDVTETRLVKVQDAMKNRRVRKTNSPKLTS